MNSHWRKAWPLLLPVLIICFTLAAWAIHYPGLKAPMVYDSTRLPALQEIDPQVGLKDFIRLAPNRPVSMLSFYLNYMVSGMDPYYFRAFNLLLLAGTAATVVAVLLLLVGIIDPRGEFSLVERRFVAVGVGVLFLLHPANSSVVLYIWQRQILLVSLFYCLALLVYLATRTGSFRSAKTGYLICFGLFVCAMLSKENAITLPLVIILAEAAFFKQRTRGLLRATGLIGGFLGISLLFKLIFESLFFGTISSTQIAGTVEHFRSLSMLTPVEIGLTVSRIVFSHYLPMVLLPLPSNVKILDAVVISRSILDPPSTLFAALGLVFLVGGSLLYLKKRPLTAFGILFFLINILPEPVLEPQFLFMGHRANLAMVGMCFVAADGLLALCGWAKRFMDSPKVLARLAVLLLVPVIWLAMVSHLRAEIWSNPLFLWKDIVRGLPPAGPNVERANYYIALGSLGREMKKIGNLDEAINLYQRALELWPTSHLAYLNLATVLALKGRIAEAIACYEKAIELEPNDAAAHFNFALCLIESGRKADAIKHLRKAVEIRPRFAKAHYRLGKLLSESGERAEGEQHIARAVEIDAGIARKAPTVPPLR